MRLIDLCEGRLDELKPSHAKNLRDMETNNPYAPNMEKYLKQNGFKLLGSGVYSQVWSQPKSNAVVKLTKVNGDKCWMSFAEYTLGHPNKHFPKISNLRVYKQSDVGKNPVFYCFVERLIHLDKIPKTKETFPLLAFLFTQMNIRLLEQEDIIKFMDEPNYSKIELEGSRYKDAQSFKAALKDLENNCPATCGMDLGKRNIMYRPSTGTLVISDPYADE